MNCPKSNSFFSETTGIILPTKISIENYLFAEHESINNFLLLSMHQIRDSPNSPKVLFILVSLDFQTLNFHTLQIRLLPPKSEFKLQHLQTSIQLTN